MKKNFKFQQSICLKKKYSLNLEIHFIYLKKIYM